MSTALPAANTARREPQPIARHRLKQLGLWRDLIIVTVVTALLWSFRFSGPIDLRYDAGVYYVLGTSLAEGRGYRLSNEPGAPLAIQYPPALPALVALHERALGTSDPVRVGVWLKRSYAVMHLLLAIGSFLVARAMLGAPLGLVAALLSLAPLNSYYLSNLLFTELPYTLVSVCLALILLSESLKERPVFREIAGFALVVAGFALRTAGLALLAAWVAEAVCRRRWRTALFRAGLALVPFVSWETYVHSVQRSEDYAHPAYAYQRAPYQFYNVSYAENLALRDPFQPELGRATTGTWLTRVAENVAVIPLSLAEATTQVEGFWSGAVKTILYPGQKKVAWLDQSAVVPLLAVALVVLLGILQFVRRRFWFPVLLIVFSIGLTCATPWPGQFSRYLAPIGPFLAIALVLGAQKTGDFIRGVRQPFIRRTGWAVAAALTVGVGCAHAFAAMNSYRSMTRVAPVSVGDGDWARRRWFYYDPGWADWDRAVNWIGRNAPPDAVIATNAPHLCYLMTGRHAVFPPMEASPAHASELLRGVSVSYVIIDELDFIDISRRYAAPAMEASPTNWKLAQRFNHTLVYERVRTGFPQ
jgi:hypothetical protein